MKKEESAKSAAKKKPKTALEQNLADLQEQKETAREAAGAKSTQDTLETKRKKDQERSRFKIEAMELGADWDSMPFKDNKKARDLYKMKLWQEMERIRKGGDPFPNSKGGINPDIPIEAGPGSEAEYEKVLTPYQSTPDDEAHHWGGLSAGVGYKLRLNVAAADVKAVSDYLNQNGYNHKFLHGADVVDGEIFTIYTGSKDRTDAVAKLISGDLDGLIKRPINNKELEFAPNVSGYFAMSTGQLGIVELPKSAHNPNPADFEFSRYRNLKNIRGIPSLYCYANAKIADDDKKPYEHSYGVLANQLGTYFTGTKQPNFEESVKMELE